jgi:hypothetical protein
MGRGASLRSHDLALVPSQRQMPSYWGGQQKTLLERRTVIVAALVIYLALSSLFCLGKPRITRVRVDRTGGDG